ncbi:MAG: hypothetical protein ICV83_29170, partial [Cytophagales bacterium]|nr:hypothetical protein [Cytophagales bacterium]
AWMKEEVAFYSSTRGKKAKIFPIFFQGLTAPDRPIPGFEALTNFVGFTEASPCALATGVVAPGVLSAIEASLGMLTRKRVFLLGLAAAALVGVAAGYGLFQGWQRKESEYWDQAATHYLAQSRPDLAEMALAKAGDLQPDRRPGLLPLYREARRMRCVVTYDKLVMPAGYRLIGGTTREDHPVVVLYSDEAKKLMAYDGKRRLALPGDWPDAPAVHAFPGKLALTTDRAFFRVRLADSVTMTEHALPEGINEVRVRGTGSGWQVLYTHGDTLTVTDYGGEEGERTVRLSKPIGEAGFLPGNAGGFYAVTRAGSSDPYTTLLRWLPGAATPQADSLPMPAGGTFYLTGATPSAGGKTFVLAYGYAADMLSPLEDYKLLYLPDDPYRKTIRLEAPSEHVQPLDDGSHYVAYLSEARDLKVLAFYDYVITRGTPRTVVTGTRLLKTWGTPADAGATMLITADDSTVRIVRGTRVIYRFTLPRAGVETVSVLPAHGYFCVASDSSLYLWKQSVLTGEVREVPGYAALREQLQVALEKGEPPVYLRFR